jgi:hypothetical protein
MCFLSSVERGLQSENKALRCTAQGASRGKVKEEAQQHEEVKPTFQVIEIK